MVMEKWEEEKEGGERFERGLLGNDNRIAKRLLAVGLRA